MIFGCQSSSEKPFVHFSAIKCSNCSRAIFFPLFSLRKDASVTSLPMPSTKSLRALRESHTPGTCSILTAIFLLQAKSPIGSIAPKWQSLQKSSLEMWNRLSVAGVRGGAVNWASDRTKAFASVFSSAGDLRGQFIFLYPCYLIWSISTFLLFMSQDRED